jgi:hypothetical protein
MVNVQRSATGLRVPPTDPPQMSFCKNLLPLHFLSPLPGQHPLPGHHLLFLLPIPLFHRRHPPRAGRRERTCFRRLRRIAGASAEEDEGRRALARPSRDPSARRHHVGGREGVGDAGSRRRVDGTEGEEEALVAWGHCCDAAAAAPACETMTREQTSNRPFECSVVVTRVREMQSTACHQLVISSSAHPIAHRAMRDSTREEKEISSRQRAVVHTHALQMDTRWGEKMVNGKKWAMQQGGQEWERVILSPLHPTLPVREHSGLPCPASPRDQATPQSLPRLVGAWGGEGGGRHWQVQGQTRQGDLPRPQLHALSSPASAPSAQQPLPFRGLGLCSFPFVLDASTRPMQKSQKNSDSVGVATLSRLSHNDDIDSNRTCGTDGRRTGSY